MFEVASEEKKGMAPPKRSRRPAKMRGVVTGITFQRDDFTIATFHPDGELTGVIIVGSMPGLVEGTELLISGRWSMHPKYGEQFKVRDYSIEQPRTRQGGNSSKHIPGS